MKVYDVIDFICLLTYIFGFGLSVHAISWLSQVA